MQLFEQTVMKVAASIIQIDAMIILLSKEFTESGQKRYTGLGVAFTLCVYTNQVETLCYPPMELISSLS